MSKLTGVSSPVILDSKPAEQSLVKRLFGIPSAVVKYENPDEYIIFEADQARIRLAAEIDEVSLAIIRGSLQDGVKKVVNE